MGVFSVFSLDVLFFSSLIVLAGTCSTMSTRSDESEHPCLVPDLRGKLCLSPLKVLAVRSYTGLYNDEVLSIHDLLPSKAADFVKSFLSISRDGSCFCIIIFVPYSIT